MAGPAGRFTQTGGQVQDRSGLIPRDKKVSGFSKALPLHFSGKTDARGWQKAFGFVKVPPEAATLVLS